MSDTTNITRAALSGSEDLYAVLGIGPEADATQIEHAFRILARRLHPDTRALDADAGQETFERALAAYAVLRDPIARRAYDDRRTVRRGPESMPGMNTRDRTTMPVGPALRIGPTRWERSRHQVNA